MEAVGCGGGPDNGIIPASCKKQSVIGIDCESRACKSIGEFSPGNCYKDEKRIIWQWRGSKYGLKELTEVNPQPYNFRGTLAGVSTVGSGILWIVNPFSLNFSATLTRAISFQMKLALYFGCMTILSTMCFCPSLDFKCIVPTTATISAGFAPSTQWEAVNMNRSSMIDPPQKWCPLGVCKDTWCGALSIDSTLDPPTILLSWFADANDINAVTAKNRQIALWNRMFKQLSFLKAAVSNCETVEDEFSAFVRCSYHLTIGNLNNVTDNNWLWKLKVHQTLPFAIKL